MTSLNQPKTRPPFSLNQPHNSRFGFQWKWWSKFVALVAAINLFLVFFNITYIPLREVYLRHFPPAVLIYDPVKGIEPHPDTTHYIETVKQLKETLNQSGFESEQTAAILADLRQQSQSIIAENPFDVANKFGTFAKLKRRMEYRVNIPYAQQAYRRFIAPQFKGDVYEV